MGILFQANSHAATSTNFQINANITNGCLINNTVLTNGASVGNLGALDFGSDSALSTSTKVSTFLPANNFLLSCTPNVALTMRINGGLTFMSTRHLKHQSTNTTIPYYLFSDSARTQSIGLNQAISVNTVISSANINLPLYGRLTLPGNLIAGNYLDTLTVTLEW